MTRLLPFALILALATPAAAATWDIDTGHSEVVFVARHLKFSKVRGNFKVWSGRVVLDDKDITKSTVEAKFDVNSLNSDNEGRDKHLKSPDFFDAAGFTFITFKSTKVEKGEGNKLKISGDLTIRGTAKPVSFEVEMSPEFKDPGGNPHLAFQGGRLKVNRHDFGLKWNKITEGLNVASDEIELEIDVELKNKNKTPAP